MEVKRRKTKVAACSGSYASDAKLRRGMPYHRLAGAQSDAAEAGVPREPRLFLLLSLAPYPRLPLAVHHQRCSYVISIYSFTPVYCYLFRSGSFVLLHPPIVTYPRARRSVTTMPGWEEATAVQKVSTTTYSCILHDDWSIGSGKAIIPPPILGGRNTDTIR